MSKRLCEDGAEAYANAVEEHLANGGVAFDMWSIGEMEASSIHELIANSYNAGMMATLAAELHQLASESRTMAADIESRIS